MRLKEPKHEVMSLTKRPINWRGRGRRRGNLKIQETKRKKTKYNKIKKMKLTKFEDFAFCITNCDLEAAFFKQILGVKTNLQQLGISELTQLLIENSNIINSMSRENLLELANHHSILVLDNPSREELLTRIENDLQQRKNILHKFFVFFQHKINCSNFSWVCEFNVDTSSVDKFVNSFESKRWALEDVLNCVKISDLKSFLKELEVVEILDKKWTLIAKIKAAVAKILLVLSSVSGPKVVLPPLPRFVAGGC